MVTNEKELYSELLDYVESKEINNRQDLVNVISEFTGLDEFDEGFDDLAYIVQKKLGVIFFDTDDDNTDVEDTEIIDEPYIDSEGKTWFTDEDGDMYYFDEDGEMIYGTLIKNYDNLDESSDVIDYDALVDAAWEAGFDENGKGAPIKMKDLKSIINDATGMLITSKSNKVWKECKDYLEGYGFKLVGC